MVSIFIVCQSVKIVPDLYEVFTCSQASQLGVRSFPSPNNLSKYVLEESYLPSPNYVGVLPAESLIGRVRTAHDRRRRRSLQDQIRQSACKGNWTIEYIIDSSHCFLAVNSSVNFFIYILRGGKFRDVILQVRNARWQQPD